MTTKETPSVPTPTTPVTSSDQIETPSPAIGSQSAEVKDVPTPISEKPSEKGTEPTKISDGNGNQGSNEVAKKRPFMMGGMTRRQASGFKRFFCMIVICSVIVIRLKFIKEFLNSRC